MRALPESVGAARPIIRRHSSTTMMAACRGVYTASPETGYSKGAVSGNKRMTDISGDPDREIAVALSTETAVYPDLSKRLRRMSQRSGLRTRLLNRVPRRGNVNLKKYPPYVLFKIRTIMLSINCDLLMFYYCERIK